MRKPSTSFGVLTWHRQALIDKDLHLEIEGEFETPQCGFFQTRLCRGGPYVPARIYIVQDYDHETEELISDEIYICEIGGRQCDAAETWHWLFRQPITEERYEFMIASRDWSLDHAPHEPIANPRKPINWLDVPLPTFKEKA
jgi:hypothetical protein